MSIWKVEAKVFMDAPPKICQDSLLLPFLNKPHASRCEDVQGGLLVLLLGNIITCKNQQRPDVLKCIVWSSSQAGQARGCLLDHRLSIFQQRTDLEELVLVPTVVRPGVQVCSGTTTPSIKHYRIVGVSFSRLVCRAATRNCCRSKSVEKEKQEKKTDKDGSQDRHCLELHVRFAQLPDVGGKEVVGVPVDEAVYTPVHRSQTKKT